MAEFKTPDRPDRKSSSILPNVLNNGFSEVREDSPPSDHDISCETPENTFKTPLKRLASSDQENCSPSKRSPFRSIENCMNSLATLEQIKQLKDSCGKGRMITSELIEKIQDQYPGYKDCDTSSLRHSIKRKLQEATTLRGEKKASFLSKIVEPPKNLEKRIFGTPETPRTHHDDKHSKVAARILHETQKVVGENRSLKSAYSDISHQNEILNHNNYVLRLEAEDNSKLLGQTKEICEQNEHLAQSNTKLVKENRRLSDKCDKLKEKCDTLKTKPNKAYDKVRNMTKMLERRDDTIESLSHLKKDHKHLEKEHSELIAELESVTKKKEESDTLLAAQKHENVCLQKRISYLNQMVQENKLDRKQLNDEVKSLRKDLDHQYEINNMMSRGQIITFEDRKFNESIREVCYKLINDGGVSYDKLPSVINNVLKPLTGLTADRLPSKGTLSNMCTEAKHITHQQAATEILSEANPMSSTGNVLHQDATSKFHRSYEGVQTTLTSGKQLSLGLRRVAGGDAETYSKVNIFIARTIKCGPRKSKLPNYNLNAVYSMCQIRKEEIKSFPKMSGLSW